MPQPKKAILKKQRHMQKIREMRDQLKNSRDAAGQNEEVPRSTEKQIKKETSLEATTAGTCLICCGNNGNPFDSSVLKRIVPRAHPPMVEDNIKVIYLLKTVFQISSAQLQDLMITSDGGSPREWVFFCPRCVPLLTDAMKAYERILEYRREVRRLRNLIFEKMNASVESEFKIKENVGKEIRSLARSSRSSMKPLEVRDSNPFSVGDREAEVMLASKRLKLSPEVYVKTEPTFTLPESQETNFNGVEDSYADEWEPFDGDGDDYNDSSDKEEDGDDDEDPEYLVPSSKRGTDAKKKKAKPAKNTSPAQKLMKSSEEKLISPHDPQKLKEMFTCPVCRPGEMNVAVPMNIVHFIPHLLFHSDKPMECSQCYACLPRDPDLLKNHWLHYHPDVTSIPKEQQYHEMALPEQYDYENGGVSSGADRALKCGNCSKREKTTYASIHQLRIHEVLKHPKIARRSCPLCPKRFKAFKNQLRSTISRHLSEVHKLTPEDQRNCQCHFCATVLSTRERGHLRLLHMISQHCELIRTSFTCTACNQECSSVAEFVQHLHICVSEHSPDFVKPSLDTLSLLIFKDGCVQCGLCDSNETYTTPAVVKAHFAFVHSLYLKWKLDPHDPKRPEKREWATTEIYVTRMRRTDSSKKQKAVRMKVREEKLKKEGVSKETVVQSGDDYLKKRQPKYDCPMCPHLEQMNIDYFIQHLIFHWRRPNKCTNCSLHLSLAQEDIEKHWKELHSNLYSKTSSMVELVDFKPGKIFECGECPERFESIENRDNHEHMEHNLNKEAKHPCNKCDKKFRNEDEMRLHKALDHPEVASDSCYYCDQVFVTESTDGGLIRDYAAVDRHIFAKTDHPKIERKLGHGIASDLDACQYCGKVLLLSLKRGSKAVVNHIDKEHGIKPTLAQSCHICNYTGQTNLYRHFETVHLKHRVCEECGAVVKPRALPEHLLTQHSITTEGYLVLHCRAEGCEYKTYDTGHMRRHVGSKHKPRQRKFLCQFCGRGFYNASHKREHERRHTNKESKPYQCEFCGASFAVRNDAYIHRRLSHLDQKFPSTNRKRSKTDTNTSGTSRAPRTLVESFPTCHL